MIVAKKILEHPLVDINIPDDSGMRAIHWASFLRADEIIKILLEGNPDVTIHASDIIHSKYNRYKAAFIEIRAADFYRENLFTKEKLNIPHQISESSNLILPMPTLLRVDGKKFEPNFFRENLNTKKEILRNELIHIPLHNLAFHIDAMCINYFDTKDKKFIPSFTLNNGPAPTNVFRKNFDEGYDFFAIKRNNIPVNHEILKILEAVELTCP